MTDDDPLDEREVCDGCFLECRAWHSTRRYPCNDELRAWAREHRDDPGTIDERERTRA
ncbi:MAG: hypothetical protein IJ092_10235 [Atopobiaceae bacterium]|nr:hypothetical protein [Atopobiaceae bacterium]